MNENLENRCMSLHDESLQQSTPSGVNIDKVIKALDGIYSRLGNWMHIKELDTITVAKELLKEKKTVVRCKDCKYKGNSVFRKDGTEYIVCWNQGYGIQHPCDWFCADGEKRNEE